MRRRYVLLICEEQSDVRNYYFMVDLNRHLSFFVVLVCAISFFFSWIFSLLYAVTVVCCLLGRLLSTYSQETIFTNTVQRERDTETCTCHSSSAKWSLVVRAAVALSFCSIYDLNDELILNCK